MHMIEETLMDVYVMEKTIEDIIVNTDEKIYFTRR